VNARKAGRATGNECEEEGDAEMIIHTFIQLNNSTPKINGHNTTQNTTELLKLSLTLPERKYDFNMSHAQAVPVLSIVPIET